MRVWVHIADVATYVSEGSLVDREAQRRATSVYVPGAVEPMLPQALSNDACSLVPGAERPAVTVEMELRWGTDRAQQVLSLADPLRRAAGLRARGPHIRRRRAGRGARGPSRLRPRARCARAAAGRESGRGGLVLDSEEPEFCSTTQGNVREIATRAQTESHRLIEHLMIAANEAVARHLSEQQGAVPVSGARAPRARRG